MNLQHLLERIHSLFWREPSLSKDHIKRLILWLENANSPSLTCEEVYSLLDEYVEHEIKGHDASRLMPLLEKHLEVCEECCEEYEALLDVVHANLEP
ncbi:MAG: hypothetical protein ACP5QU_01010 [Anaerolineae bacterium]